MRGSPQHRRAGGLTGVLVILIALAVSPRAFSQAVMSVSDIAAYSLEHNRQIKDAEKNLADARETISQFFTLDKSSLSLSSGYNYTPAGGAQDTQQTQQVSEHTVDIDGSVTVPIIPELSVSASLGDTFFDDRADTATASVRLAFNPFAGTQTAWKEWETLRKAEIQLANLKNSIPMQAEVAALNLLKGQLDLDSADRAMKLAERKYEIYQKRYDLDDITYSQLEEARTDANTSRQQYYNSMKSLLSLKKNLYQIIGPDLGDIEVSDLSADDVLGFITEREAALKKAEAGGAATVSLLNLAVETEALKRELDATPVFRPSLSLSGTMNIFDFRAGASVSLTLSPDQWQREERSELEEQIADRQTDLLLEQANVDLEVRMLKQSISVAREALEISISDYESSQVQYKEAELFHTRGERTDLELEQSGLSVFSSSIRLFSSAVDLYKNLGELLQLFLLD